jgi:hypothetical protein
LVQVLATERQLRELQLLLLLVVLLLLLVLLVAVPWVVSAYSISI